MHIEKNIQKNKIYLKVLVVLILSVLCCQPAFADAASSFKSGITKAYTILRTIATAGGALGLTGCGIALVTGSDKDAERAKTAIKYILIAVIGVWILPAVIRFGKGMFGSAWDPHSLG